MRSFEMNRRADESGVSGTGKVLEGIIFSDGPCVVRWIADHSPARSESRYDSYGAFVAIHIAPHPTNGTEIRFSDGEVITYDKVETTTTRLPKPRRRRKTPVPEVSVGSRQVEGGVLSDAGIVAKVL